MSTTETEKEEIKTEEKKDSEGNVKERKTEVEKEKIDSNE